MVYSFTRPVRANGLDMPFIMMTGHNSPDILKKLGVCDVSAVLIKLVRKDRLIKAVERFATFIGRKGAL